MIRIIAAATIVVGLGIATARLRPRHDGQPACLHPEVLDAANRIARELRRDV